MITQPKVNEISTPFCEYGSMNLLMIGCFLGGNKMHSEDKTEVLNITESSIVFRPRDGRNTNQCALLLRGDWAMLEKS
jgi:hypothetical protein